MQTIHIDDLARNFAMNPGEGLRVNLCCYIKTLTDYLQIRAFHHAGTHEGMQDRELVRLGDYVCLSASPRRRMSLTQ